MPSSAVKARSALGVATRIGDKQRIAEARRNLAAANIESYVAKVVAKAPPLTDTQANRIAAMLRPYGGDAE